MDAHLVRVPRLGTLTTGRLPGRDIQPLGREPNRALDRQGLALGALNELAADLLERLDLAGGQGDADLMLLLFPMPPSAKFPNKPGCPRRERAYRRIAEILVGLLVGHFGGDGWVLPRLGRAFEYQSLVKLRRWGGRLTMSR